VIIINKGGEIVKSKIFSGSFWIRLPRWGDPLIHSQVDHLTVSQINRVIAVPRRPAAKLAFELVVLYHLPVFFRVMSVKKFARQGAQMLPVSLFLTRPLMLYTFFCHLDTSPYLTKSSRQYVLLLFYLFTFAFLLLTSQRPPCPLSFVVCLLTFVP
jgi:hypothetical protein